ncbi:hypothetical protein J3A83DRAFT_2096177 [Scleroderma citrinum]
MSLTAVRIELPACSHSFTIAVPATSTIGDVKQAISTSCVGHPRPEGQRIIWRGRYLFDEEKIAGLWSSMDEQRILHLSVQPSAWTGTPPGSRGTSPSSPSVPPPHPDSSNPPSIPPECSGTQPSTGLIPDETLAFVRHKHWQALHILSNFKVCPPAELADTSTKRSAAKLLLERRGYAWPTILDSDYPPCTPTLQDHVDYDIVTLSDQSYLALREPIGTPSAMQWHALKILTYTFSILSLPPIPSPLPTPTIPETPFIPPEVNDLLRHLGLPPLRVIPNINVDPTPQPGAAPADPAAAEQAGANLMREVPIRALLAPMLMVVLRTVLLLYFFAPTRKPILGLFIVAWIIYEMWTHVRIVMLQPLNRENGDVAAADADRATPAPGPPAPPNAQDSGQIPPEPRTQNADDTQQPVQGPPTLAQSHGLIDSLALMNVHNENKLLWPTQPMRVVDPLTFAQKAIIFLSLIIATLHPEVYNRRKTALRQREGRLRTEMNAIEHVAEATEGGEPSEDEVRRQRCREQLQIQHARRAGWVREYVIRVRSGDWIDE